MTDQEFQDARAKGIKQLERNLAGAAAILDAYIGAGLPRTNFTEQAQDAQSRIECALATLKVMAASYRPQVADDLDANTLTRVADKLEAVFDAWAQAQQIATDERERRTLEGAR